MQAGPTTAVPFARPYTLGTELDTIVHALEQDSLAGNGPYSERCARWLRDLTGAEAVLMTPSCTAALELAALLLDVDLGDEVVMPSFAFPSLASAFVLRGATPVFVDIDPATLGVDTAAVAAAVTDRTRVLCALHYGGVACDMPALRRLADDHGLALLEDNAHGLMATLDGRPLGSFGDLSVSSFHATKNIQVGEGGALVVNDPALVDRAQVLQEKGTDRTRFLRGEVDRYQWQEPGMSALLGELPAAALWSQLHAAADITAERRALVDEYRAAFADLDAGGWVTLPALVPGREPDGHVFYILAATPEDRSAILDALHAAGIGATFHYVPLHSAPAGRRHGRTHGSMAVTDRVAETIVRLPLWPGLPEDVPLRAAAAVREALSS